MIKQVIIIRRDLKMRRGKEIAQGAHASMKWLSKRLSLQGEALAPNKEGWTKTGRLYFSCQLTIDEAEWLSGPFTKICLQVETEAELLALQKAAFEAGLNSELICDSGATEFHDIPTNTALAIGPNKAEEIDKITQHLKLY